MCRRKTKECVCEREKKKTTEMGKRDDNDEAAAATSRYTDTVSKELGWNENNSIEFSRSILN